MLLPTVHYELYTPFICHNAMLSSAGDYVTMVIHVILWRLFAVYPYVK